MVGGGLGLRVSGYRAEGQRRLSVQFTGCFRITGLGFRVAGFCSVVSTESTAHVETVGRGGRFAGAVFCAPGSRGGASCGLRQLLSGSCFELTAGGRRSLEP